ncbi:MAG: N-6 DNA methylase [Campylobacter sp.]|uniref:N-6 DNA methylase n=1 Tax=Campylobacter sp. TaxID=205 RepID=UPI002A839502|nr:N-6 DNA methylase [Campylobacter sp.]MDY5115519.1 N-6 DNA methylase [Campylobacter sp.]
MITKDNLKEVLSSLGFSKSGDIFSKNYTVGVDISVDFKTEKIIYPKEIKKGDETTSNFSGPENFVVLECVNRLLEKGYKAKHIELEPRWRLGRESKKSGKADIIVKNHKDKTYIMIECKTFGDEYKKEWNNMNNYGGQLFSYFQQDKDAKFLCLYTSDFSNNQIIFDNKIISTTDDDEVLARKSAKIEQKGYQGASKVEDLYNVWNEIYERTSYTSGIFENDINAYEAGKTTRTYDKLKEITQKDEGGKSGEDGKYHEFAKILRKHNISGKENAFDKLVNLFLCKIYDEKFNPNNLEFCWRGAMSDSFESLQDRLMLLYKEAMKEFLDETITYVSDDDIDRQFEDFESKKIKTKMLKEQMHEYLRQLKFYSHSDFSFLEVHNKDLFVKNAAVLKEVVELFEDYKLTSDKTTQILGNLFELFLQKGMKQDEGQFFTPLQICEFIMYSLPIREMLEQNPKLKVIDYACGAGHFLNTYANVATQINPNHKSDIYGIEKEYRLNKVSKVSSAMYAHDIKFTYADALDKGKFKEKDFNLLVANPPYSVKGFLETLDKDIRKSYKLYTDNLNLETNTIECFFVERANDILKSGAKAAIILPSSILNKDGIYEKTREIILSNFDIVAINELPSGTFGATGTNTIILFLNKKITYDMSQDSQNVLNALNNIDQELDKNAQYLQDALKDYCALQSYDIDAYTSFLNGILSVSLENTEIFTEYKIAFEKSSEYKNLLKSRAYKDSSNQSQLEKEAFIIFARNIEKNKLLYFSLIHKQKTMIIQAPSDNKAIKKFLGYEWSNAKGAEGLHELGEPYTTPLYERENIENKNKIAYLIRQAFLNGEIEISPELSDFAIYAPLHSCIDFKSANFNKAINLSLATAINPFENSKYQLVKLENTLNSLGKGKRPASFENKDGSIPFYKSSFEVFKCDIADFNTEALIIGDGGTANINYINGEFSASDHSYIFSSKENSILKFIFFVIKSNLAILQSGFKGIGIQNIAKSYIENIKIPLPPLDIQKQIVAECESVESENSRILNEIAEQKEQINRVLAKTGILNVKFQDNENLKDLPTPQDYNLTEWENKNLREIKGLNFNPSKSEISKLPLDTKVSFVEMASVSNNGYIENKIDKTLEQVKGSYTYFIENDIILAKITPCMENGKCAIAKDLTNQIGFGSSEFHVFRTDNTKINIKFLFVFLNRDDIRKRAEKSMTGSSGHRRVPISFYENLQIPLPPLEAQEKIVQAINSIEQKISSLQTELNSLNGKQKEILEKYLF